MIILKVTKNQGVTLSLEDTVFEKLQGVGQIDPPSPLPSHFRVKDFFSNYDQVHRNLLLFHIY